MLTKIGYLLKRIGILFCVWTYIHCLQETKNTGYCDFPHFIWSHTPPKKEPQRIWFNRAEYSKNTQTLTREREIKASKSEFTTSVVIHELCEDYVYNNTYPCSKARVKSRTLCIAAELGGIYRVQIQEDGKSIYSCMKFIQRSSSVVQIKSVVMQKKYNEDLVCREQFLRRDPWPWIADGQQDWTFCPFAGGYSFRANLNGERDVCDNDWSPSRLESECISGEGMQFIFQERKCSIFPSEINTELQFYCWASWEEDEYVFTLLAQQGQRPQLVLRLPKHYQDNYSFTAILYYNPICSLKGRGQPNKDIFYLSLQLKSNDPGLCLDESEKCAEFAREGKCTMMKLHEIASQCKKSCGLCGKTASNLAASLRYECLFPEEYLGGWTLYEDVLREHVHINEGQIAFQQLGTYMCKGKHWNKNLYKMLSKFDNGCRPRYTCFKFRRDGSALHYQMSKSFPGDQSFEMCDFKDDPEPLGNRIRSKSMKILLPVSSTRLGSCGLSGKIEVGVTFADGSSCDGTVSDWDFNRCEASPHLELNLHPCNNLQYKDFHCVAHTTLSNGVSVLITDEKDGNGVTHYSCWMVKSYVEGNPDHPWSNAYLLPGAQCGSSRKFANIEEENTMLIISSKDHPDSPFYPNHIQRPCYQTRPTHKSGGMMMDTATTTRKLITIFHSTPRSEINTPPMFQNEQVEIPAPKYGIHLVDSTPGLSKRNKDRLLRHSTKTLNDSHLKSSANNISLITRHSNFILVFLFYKLYISSFVS